MIQETQKPQLNIPVVSGSSLNEINKVKYERYRNFHIDDGGKFPDDYAITELIKQSILDKDYKIYYGGGYEANTHNEIKQFDIVVTFNWGGDPFFQMCLDNSDGDACKLINSNDKCEFITKYL